MVSSGLGRDRPHVVAHAPTRTASRPVINWARVGVQHCHKCGRRISRQSIDEILRNWQKSLAANQLATEKWINENDPEGALGRALLASWHLAQFLVLVVMTGAALAWALIGRRDPIQTVFDMQDERGTRGAVSAPAAGGSAER